MENGTNRAVTVLFDMYLGVFCVVESCYSILLCFYYCSTHAVILCSYNRPTYPPTHYKHTMLFTYPITIMRVLNVTIIGKQNISYIAYGMKEMMGSSCIAYV